MRLSMSDTLKKIRSTNAKQPVKVFSPEERAELALKMGIKARPASAEEKAAALLNIDVEELREHIASGKEE
jgi:hypothetical protein